LSYSLPIDQFTGAPDDEVREAFRRMNANNVPLNDEEQRNAKFQGPFKWAIVKIADKYQSPLAGVGLFSRRDLVRMSDLKLYAEIILALDDRKFVTVKGKQLDDLYKKYNGTYPVEEEMEQRVCYAIEVFLDDVSLHQKTFVRPHVFQSLILAIYAGHDRERFREYIDVEHADLVARVRQKAVPLDVLAVALQDPDSYPEISEFVEACSKKTNVEDAKRIRFVYFREALAARA
jgi:hypothetical protein